MKKFLAALTLASALSPAALTPAVAQEHEITLECWEYYMEVVCSQSTGQCWVENERWIYIC